jgi:lambda repressor-like predicted transcriptional regulator
MRNDNSIAKQLYTNGVSLKNISVEMGIPLSTLKSWSSKGMWKEARLRNDKLESRIMNVIDSHLSYMEEQIEIDKPKRIDKEAVSVLKDLMGLRETFQVTFSQKLSILQEAIRFAQEKGRHTDAQVVADVAKQYAEDQLDKLED